MAVLRTRRLVAYAQAVADAAEYPYTVPAGHRAVLRDFTISNHTGTSSSSNSVFVLTSGGTVAVFLFSSSLTAGADYHWTGDMCLEAGDVIGLACSVVDVTIWASGALLDL